MTATAPARTHRGPVAALLGAVVVSSVGSQITWLALPWFVLTTTGSAAQMGATLAASVLPVALLGIPSALLLHRLGPRRTMLLCDLARAPIIAAIPVLHGAGLLSFSTLLGLVAAAGAAAAPYQAALRLALPGLIGRDDVSLVRGNSMVEAAGRTATLAGPAVAGLLITLCGVVAVLWIDAASYLVSAALIALLPRTPQATGGPARPGHLGRGLRLLAGSPILRRIAAAAVIAGIVLPVVFAGLPVLTIDRYGADPRIPGLLLSSWGIGSLVGALVAIRAARFLRTARAAGGVAVLSALPLATLAIPLPISGAAAALALAAFFVPLMNAPLMAILITHSSDDTRPAVLAFLTTASFLAGPAGYAVGGWALGWFGPTLVLLATPLALLVCAVLLGTAPTETPDGPRER